MRMPAQPLNVILVPPQLLTPVQLSPGIIQVPLPVVPPQLCPKPVRFSSAVQPVALPVILMVRCVLPFLDSYEVLYTTKWEKMLNKLAKRAPLGASASNQWGWGFC